MGTIEHRGKNSWRIGERLPASQGRDWVRRTFTYPDTMTEAEQRRAVEIEMARLTVDIEDGRAVPEAPLTVRQLADIWLRDHVTPNCKRTTAATYRHLLEGRILPAIGDRKVTSLKPLDITRLLNSLREADKKTTAIPAELRARKKDRERPSSEPGKLSDKTLRHYYDVLNYMFNKGVQWELIQKNPLDKVDRPKAKRAKLKYLDDVQAVNLLRKLATVESLPFRCSVLLALLCGLRLGEVGGLYLDDVNWERCTITVERGLNYTPADGNYMDTPKSDAGEREITLPAGMMTLLHETRAYHADVKARIGDRWHGDGRIVCAWDGAPLHHDTPSKQFRKFADANGYEGVRFHDLRHTHAVLLFADNIDAVAVAARLGHASPETTLRNYAHAIRRRDLESANAMQKLVDMAAQPENASPQSPQTVPTSE